MACPPTHAYVKKNSGSGPAANRKKKSSS